MDKKEEYFWQLFKQESFVQHFNVRLEINTLLGLLSDKEVNDLFEMNTVFIRCCSPASKMVLAELDHEAFLTLIMVDQDYYKEFFPHEFVAVLLHEIGHALNNQLKGMEGEYAADKFATDKGYGKWIITGLQKGLQKKWIGFEKNNCDLRVANISKHLNGSIKYDL